MKSVFSLQKGVPVPYDRNLESGTYIPLPAWSSADGFALMDQYAHMVHNPVISQKLIDVLGEGRGVFRLFKDVLRTRPELYNRWKEFKNRQMEKRVRQWYVLHRGAIAYGEDAMVAPEIDLEGALLGEFSAHFCFDGEFLEPLMQKLLAPLSAITRCRIEDAVNRYRGSLNYLYISDASDNVCAMMVFSEEENLARVLFYGVDKSFRGIGLFRLMLDTMVRQAARQKIDEVVIDFSSESMVAMSVLSPYQPETVYRSESIPVQRYSENAPSTEEAYL